jgi:hypothetical protein
VLEVTLSSAGGLAAIVEIAFGHDAEGTDGGEYAALSAADLVHPIPFSNWPPLAPARQVEILREHMSRVVIIVETALTAPPRLPRSRPPSPRSRSSVDRGSYLSHMLPSSPGFNK